MNNYVASVDSDFGSKGLIIIVHNLTTQHISTMWKLLRIKFSKIKIGQKILPLQISKETDNYLPQKIEIKIKQYINKTMIQMAWFIIVNNKTNATWN